MNELIKQTARRLASMRQAEVEILEEAPAASSPTESSQEHFMTQAGDLSGGLEIPRHSATPYPVFEKLDVTRQSRRVEIDFESVAAMGVVGPQAPRSQLTDELRVIKRPLLKNVMARHRSSRSNLIMVTSALPGEGKSFLAANLAMSIAAEIDHTVMLVDADVSRPSILQLLGLPPAPGLLDLLEGKYADLSEVLLRTNVEKLSLLPSGSRNSRMTEMLASDAMAALLDEMANRYPERIILFDSPPLLLTTESRVLATHMGQVVMVVRAEQTLQNEVRQALATLEACPVKLMVLNQARAQAADQYGYY